MALDDSGAARPQKAHPPPAGPGDLVVARVFVGKAWRGAGLGTIVPVRAATAAAFSFCPARARPAAGAGEGDVEARVALGFVTAAFGAVVLAVGRLVLRALILRQGWREMRNLFGGGGGLCADCR